MLLNEFKQTPLTEYENASKLLESTYGVKIKPTTETYKLFLGVTNANKILENLKYQNRAIDDSEVSKYTLIKETLLSLLECESDRMLLEFNVSNKFESQLRDNITFAYNELDKGKDPSAVLDAVEDRFHEEPSYFSKNMPKCLELFNFNFLKYLGQVGREDLSNAWVMDTGITPPPMSHTIAPATHLFDDMTSEEIVEAIEQMEAINEGLLTEAEVDNDQLVAIAEAIVEGRFDSEDSANRALSRTSGKDNKVANAYLKFKNSNLELAPKGNLATSRKDPLAKPTKAKDANNLKKAQKLGFAEEEAVDEGPDSFMKSEKKPSPEAAAFRKRMQAKKGN